MKEGDKKVFRPSFPKIDALEEGYKFEEFDPRRLRPLIPENHDFSKVCKVTFPEILQKE